MTKEQALQQLREAREEFELRDGIVHQFKDNVSPFSELRSKHRKQAYNRWIAAVQTFRSMDNET
jgi:hypothetical protein